MPDAQGSTAFENDMAAWKARDDRLKTILMVGRITTHSGDHLCRIRNISSGGMLIECETKLILNEPVKVELRNLKVVSARVRWIKDHRAGIEFDAEIDVADFLYHAPESKFRPRAPRLGASCPVIVWCVGHNRPATLIDVSQTGCRLEVNEKLVVGVDVRITIPGLPARHGTLRWAKMGVAGFSFNEPFSFAELASWDKTRVA